MNKLYEALEVCLHEIELGASVDTVLARYPELADELRPILEASMAAKDMAIPTPSHEMMRRNRAKVLQRASELRERKVIPAGRMWPASLRRTAVSLAVIVVMLMSTTGLVRASSNTLPGDNLYPVKRTWESVSLFFTFDVNRRTSLELEHENERLDEVHELFARGRSVSVDFSGYVTRQNGTEWRIAGITVLITPDTLLPNSPIAIGDAVSVLGQTQGDGGILATQIRLVSPGSIVPEVNDDAEEGPEGSNQSVSDDAGGGVETEATPIPVAKTPIPTIKVEATKTKVKDISLEGKVSSIENNFIVIDGIVMDIRNAEIKGTLSAGVTAKVEGYYDANGVFIVTKVEFEKSSSNSGSGSSSGNNNNTNTNTNENTNDGGGHDTGSNDNGGDDHGGNSGSGGSGDD